jgi:hypothetical protein
MVRLIAIAGALLSFLAASGASAQDFDETIHGDEIVIESPERFSLELRVGVYQPDTAAFDMIFDDLGPMLGVELDVIVFRLEDIGWLGVGGSFGWGSYSGFTLATDGTPTNEETVLTLMPFPVLAVLRIDVLARLLDIPFAFQGKIGPDFVLWINDGRTSTSNVAIGLRWAAQVALELDWFDRRAARGLDDEWGINHSYFFFEIYGSTAGGSMEVATPFAWTLGLSLTF